MSAPTLETGAGLVIACGWFIGLTVALVLRLIYA